MKLPKLYRLRKAIQNLDVHFIARNIAQLEDHLVKSGRPLEPDCTAVTEEGIFYISPETGMATKVVLYLADHPGFDENGYSAQPSLITGTRPAIVNRQLEYHILRCNTMRSVESLGWPGHYRISQRMDGTFSCRVLERSRKRRKISEDYVEIDDQQLKICPNCFFKVTSLLDGVRGIKQDDFKLRYFFDVDFTRPWMRSEKLHGSHGSLDAIYPRDWLEISRIRKTHAQFHCESCETDLSHPNLQKYLYVHHTDHIKRKVGYVRLECLCVACLAELPSHQHLKSTHDYNRFLEKREAWGQY